MRVRLAALSVLFVLAFPQAASAWTWPVDGPVLRPFSFGSDPYAAGQHRGIDIGAPSGTAVRAAAGGVVTFAGTVPNGGKTVTIQTATGYAVTHVHLGSIGVLRGTTIEEGAIVGTVGPSGVPDIAEPYVYLGIRVASDDQGYVDPLLFLPPRPAPPAPAADSPSEPAGEAPAGEASAPPVVVEPPSEPVTDAGSAPDEGGAPDTGAAASPAGGAAESGSAETSPATGEEAAATPEPSSTPARDARSDAGGAEQPPVAIPAGQEELASPNVATPPAAEPQAADVSSQAPAVAPAQEPVGGRGVAAPALPAQTGAVGGGRSRTNARAPAGAGPDETAAYRPARVVAAEHHATPAWVPETQRAQVLPAATHQRPGAARVWPSARVRNGRPDQADSTATGGADATVRGVSHAGAATAVSLHGGLWLAAALAAALGAALLLRRCRRRPGATPAGAEATRMMVLVGGSGHAVEARRVDRQPRRPDAATAHLDQHERLAA